MNDAKIVKWVLRIAVAGEFIGHGVFALQGKKTWIGWISQLTGAEVGVATIMLTIVGLLDLLVALIVLTRPIRLVLLWAAFWGFGQRLSARLSASRFGTLLNVGQTGERRWPCFF